MTFFLLFLMSSESGTAHFTVSTINVRGLNDPLQRRHIFQSLINSNFDSYCLQETHGKSDTINAWRKEWPGRSFWCPTNNPRSSGVAILLHPNCQAELVEEKYDEDGRIICLHLKIQKSYIQILNIYAPTKGSSRSYFFSNITNFIFQGIPLILAGDFNCVENTLNDRMGSFEPTHDIGMREIKKLQPITAYRILGVFLINPPANSPGAIRIKQGNLGLTESTSNETGFTDQT